MLDTCQLCENYTEVMFAQGVQACYACQIATSGEIPEEDYDTEEL